MKIHHLINTKLRKTVRDVPQGEKEVQDRLEDVFTGADLDGHFTREKERFGFSAKSYIPDFIFERIDTVVEVKLCKTELDVRNIISQINDDIIAYRTKYSNIIFVVYDLGKIRDQDEFKRGLEISEQVIIMIVKQ